MNDELLEKHGGVYDRVEDGVIEFWTPYATLLLDDALHPKPAGKVVPAWRKEIPSQVPYYEDAPARGNCAVHGDREIKSIKTCPGILDYMKTGFIIPMWTDLTFERVDRAGNPDSEGEYIHYSNPMKTFQVSHDQLVGMHTRTQITGTPLHDDMIPLQDYCKPLCPWYIRTPMGWSSLFGPVTNWHDKGQEPCLRPVTGIADTDIWHQSHVPSVWTRSDRFMTIRAGTPFVHIIPIPRPDVELGKAPTKIRLRLIKDKVQHDQLHSPLHYDTAPYRKLQNARDRSMEAGTCPFHGGLE